MVVATQRSDSILFMGVKIEKILSGMKYDILELLIETIHPVRGQIEILTFLYANPEI
jgi:hypothetical protein